MEEGTSKAIPLRRPRSAARAIVVRSPRGWGGRLARGSLRAGMLVMFEPPRQLWLAGLGTAALAIRTVHASWTHLVSEGRRTEAWLRGATS